MAELKTLLWDLGTTLTSDGTYDEAPRRAPRGFDSALDALQFPNKTLDAFRKGGFWSWYAYSFSNNETKSMLENLPGNTLQTIIAQLSHFTPVDTIKHRIYITLYNSRIGLERQKKLERHGIALPELSPPAITSPAHSSGINATAFADPEIAHLASNPAEILTNQEITQSTNTNSMVVSEEANMHSRTQYNMIQASQRGVYKQPYAKHLPFVFCSNMARAIVKSDLKAYVELEFADDPANCRICLYISGQNVPYIAKEIFDVQVQDNDGKRSLILDNGTAIRPKTSVMLDGATTEGLDKVFGQIPSAAFRNSHYRCMELLNGELRSNYLTMQIWEDPKFYAKIEFMVEPAHLTGIRHKLFPEGNLAEE